MLQLQSRFRFRSFGCFTAQKSGLTLSTLESDSKALPFRRLKPSRLCVPLFSLGGWLHSGKTSWEIRRRKYPFRHSDLMTSTTLHLGTQRGPYNGGLSRKQRVSVELQMDYVNVIFAYRPDPTVLMEGIFRPFDYEIEKGWVLYWVTSEWPAWEIEDAFRPIAEWYQHNFHEYVCEQAEEEYTPLYKKHGVGTNVWSSFASGILTGKILYASCTAEGREKIRKVKELGCVVKGTRSQFLRKILIKILPLELETTIASLALTWVAKHPDTSTVILGTTRPQQIINNLKAI
ncbi:NADP-dependent oxidoreductase domain-containing protein [Lentinula lateritia]|uniref:NADP-dependent oxidoreductase domain-containing protein n=1 Tax=Lentinula lateritia TaxID=40482 RepID=A0ABQ8V5Z5_9AGAR|nr:NADP-dependent oxidoreductase domain-containing protein [Lentinula lateritia]